MNESVECTPQVSTRELRAELSRVLKGLAEWQGDKLVMADPNGTRPYPPEEIGRVITAPLPKGLDNRQAAAVDKWIDNINTTTRRRRVDALRRRRERIWHAW